MTDDSAGAPLPLGDASALLAALDDRCAEELSRIGSTIGYGNAQAILGRLWDEVLMARYGVHPARGQMGVTVDDASPLPVGWRGFGRAPGCSPRAAQASEALHAAAGRLFDVLRDEYPMGGLVEVVHRRGAFRGRVTGWAVDGCSVGVKNERTGKTAKWWAAQVQLVKEEKR